MSGFPATVQQQTREGRSSDSEKQRQLDQLTRFANQASSTTAELTTAKTNTATVIWTSDEVPFNSTVLVQAKVTGDSAAGADFGHFEYAAAFQRAATGAATQQGATTQKMAPIRSNAAVVVTMGVDANSKIWVKVNDGNQATLDWKAWIEVRLQ